MRLRATLKYSRGKSSRTRPEIVICKAGGRGDRWCENGAISSARQRTYIAPLIGHCAGLLYFVFRFVKCPRSAWHYGIRSPSASKFINILSTSTILFRIISWRFKLFDRFGIQSHLKSRSACCRWHGSKSAVWHCGWILQSESESGRVRIEAQ